jgi:aldehyde:ferredoxin oxidoreductase
MQERAFNGKILNVDLGTGVIEAEHLPEQMYRSYLGGYGLGARLLFDRIPRGADPLGPDNVLGLCPGLLTGTPLFGIRYQAVGKSPKTGGWGDANAGGDVGPYLKNAGWDAVLFRGISERPVYLHIEDDKATLQDAADLWGMDAIAVEKKLKERHGKKASIACIGEAGEKLSYMAGICNEWGRLAGRSGLGAVMGSKRLKAVAVNSSRAIILGDDKDIRALLRTSLNEFIQPLAGYFRTYGTTGGTAGSALSGDSPVKNWGGAGTADFPPAMELLGDNFNKRMQKHYACWHCPIACGAESKESENPEYPYPARTHRAEYETACAFGTLSLNADVDFLQYANHLCNLYGLDTIAAGAVISFGVECFENGLITKEDTDGIDLRWSNPAASVAMLHKIAKREGFGDILADGVKKAAERIGPRSQPFAIHIAGEELAMHDPKFQPEYHTTYKLDPTPARHTQYDPGARAQWGVPATQREKGVGSGRAAHHKGAAEYMHVVNATGMCMFITMAAPNNRIPEWINATTGWDTTNEELLKAGERIANLRMAFEVREGGNPAKREVPGRLLGSPPLKEGPFKDFTLDWKTQEKEFLEACDWDLETTKPSRRKLEELGLKDVADVLYA